MTGRDSASSAQLKHVGTCVGCVGMRFGMIGDEGGRTVAEGTAGGSGSVHRHFRTVGHCSEMCGVGGLCLVACDVAWPGVVDTFALLCLGSSKCVVHMSGRLVDGSRTVVSCSKLADVSETLSIVCDVAETVAGNVVALSHSNGSVCIVHASEGLIDSSRAVVLRAKAVGARGSGGTACDVVDSGGGLGHRMGRWRMG